MKTKIKRNRGIEELKSRYGLMFVLPWIIGLIMFFFVPIFQSLFYSFCSVVITSDGVITTWVGLENYHEILKVDPNYTTWLSESVLNFAYSLPIILVLSLVLAMILNQKFRGRIFFRALYFLPVIIATGKVMGYIFMTTNEDLASMGVSSGMASGLISVEDLTGALNLSNDIADFVSNAINNIFNLVWSCGIQIVLFIAGLQSIPASLYEASRVEGATIWEEFWFITFPMMSRVVLLVGVFTMVELFTDKRSSIISSTSKMMSAGNYDETSAMLWFYFLIVGVIMGLIIALYNHFLLKKWK